MSDELCFADATELAGLVRSRQVSPVDIVEAHLHRIELVNPKIDAIVTLMAERARETAKKAEVASRTGEASGVFHGAPFSVKDSIDTQGVATQRGSLLFAGHLPSADATVVTRMKAAGAIALMKTNVPEFSMWWEVSIGSQT